VLARVSGVVFDVDDTITRGGRVERAAYDAMWRLADAGIARVAVTGRPLGFAEVAARWWPIDVAVGENGAGFIAVRDGALVEGWLEGTEARSTHPSRLERVRARVASELPEVRVAGDQWARRADLAFDVGESVALGAGTIARLVAVIESEGVRTLVSSVHAHALPGDWDKARGAVRAIREVLGADVEASPDRWLFVGDSGNDADAFAYFPVAVGVANVAEHVARLPVPPKWITRNERGLGFAEVTDAILAAKAERR
jgi:HAD superfamily hydrolase (TIGR01484 family)